MMNLQRGLAPLINPHTISEFMNSYYHQKTPFLLQQTKTQLTNTLTKLPFLSSLENLLLNWSSTVQVHLPDQRDESSSIESNPQDAIKLFQNGMGLLFNDAQRISPELQLWLQQIQNDLGLSQLTKGRCLIYATPNGKGTSAHFDQNINFILQIHGTKVWKLAPNHHVTNPMSRHSMGTSTDPEMLNYLTSPLPTTFADDAYEVTLNPGSLLFVPRGYWHATQAEGDALALNFTYTSPTWIDLFTAALQSRLGLEDQWRESADGVSNPLLRAQAEDQFDDLILNLKEIIWDLKAADILAMTEY
jgi:50S ribosomal protein L16 3-hydroxylase